MTNSGESENFVLKKTSIVFDESRSTCNRELRVHPLPLVSYLVNHIGDVRTITIFQ